MRDQELSGDEVGNTLDRAVYAGIAVLPGFDWPMPPRLDSRFCGSLAEPGICSAPFSCDEQRAIPFLMKINHRSSLFRGMNPLVILSKFRLCEGSLQGNAGSLCGMAVVFTYPALLLALAPFPLPPIQSGPAR